MIGAKFRQGGFTTTILSWLLWKALSSKINILCVSKTDKMAYSMSYTIEHFINNLPYNIDLIRQNDHLFEFENGSKIIFRSIGAVLPTFFISMSQHLYMIWMTIGKLCIL